MGLSHIHVGSWLASTSTLLYYKYSCKPHPLQREEGSGYAAIIKLLPRQKLAVTNEIRTLRRLHPLSWSSNYNTTCLADDNILLPTSLSPRPKTNPTADRFQYTGNDIRAGWGLEDETSYLPVLHNNCIPRWQPVGYSMTRPYLCEGYGLQDKCSQLESLRKEKPSLQL